MNIVKRFGLGVVLIVLTSAILLLTDRGNRTGAPAHALRVAILQHANTPVLDEGVRGVLDGLAERGFRDHEKVTIEQFNAQGDMPTGIAIARQVTAGGYDLVITSSTPSMQAVANVNREGKTRHVFSLVADPFSAGVGLDRADPMKHPAHMVGQGSFPPVDKAFQLARLMLPSLQRVGVAWNPAESNSLAFVLKARQVSAAMGITLLEANADNTSAVGDAIASLLARDAQALWIGGDNTVIAAVNSVIALAQRAHIPVFTVLPGAPDRGTLFDAGPDFFSVGHQAALLAADVLEGADMRKIPIRDILDIVPSYLSVNTVALKGLKEPWRFPDQVTKEATVLVDETGVHRKATKAQASATTAGVPPASTKKKWKLALVHLNRIVDAEEAEHGVLDGLREAGVVEGRDFEKTVRDAQGDMATVSSLIDAAVGDRADMLLAFSTPTLQAALQRAKQVPIVFNYVADPFAAGAGTSPTAHPPNVTGVYLLGSYAQMIPLIQKYLPSVRVLGTVYAPAEVNMVSQREALLKAMEGTGLQLKAVPANSTSDVADATLALIAGRIDALCQLPGNLTAAAFPSIAQVARRSRMPVFGFQGSQARTGAAVVMARDYYDSGREAAKLAARVMRGESPAGIPFVGFSQTKLLVNETVVRELGLKSPPQVLAKADEVIGR